MPRVETLTDRLSTGGGESGVFGADSKQRRDLMRFPMIPEADLPAAAAAEGSGALQTKYAWTYSTRRARVPRGSEDLLLDGLASADLVPTNLDALCDLGLTLRFLGRLEVAGTKLRSLSRSDGTGFAGFSHLDTCVPMEGGCWT